MNLTNFTKKYILIYYNYYQVINGGLLFSLIMMTTCFNSKSAILDHLSIFWAVVYHCDNVH